MTKVWMAGWVLAVSGCAVSGNGAQTAAARDASIAQDVPGARDVARPTDKPAATDPFAFTLSDSWNSGLCLDGLDEHVTVFDDGRVRRVASGGLLYVGRTGDDSARLPGGAADLHQAQVDLEATGISDVPEGRYHPSGWECEEREFQYRRGERVFSWTLTGHSFDDHADPPPPAALEAAIRVAAAAVASVRWDFAGSSDE